MSASRHGLIAGVWVLLGACGRPPEPRAHRPEEPPTGAAPQEQTRPEARAPRAARLVHVLAPSEAEVWQGQTLWIPFGDESSAKYTLGGWRTGLQRLEDAEGVLTTLMTATRGSVFVPWPSGGRVQVTVSFEAFRCGTVRFSMNGERVHEVAVQPGAQTVSFVAQCGPSGAVIRIEGPPLTELRSGVSASLSLSWMRVSPEGVTSPTDFPTDWSQTLGGAPALHLSSGLGLVYRFEVPSGGLLRGVWSNAEQPLELSVRTDGRETAEVRRAPLGPFEVDLGEFAGQLVRLEVRGSGKLVAPAIMTTADPVPSIVSRPARNVLVYLTDTVRHDKLRPYNPASRVRAPGLERFVENATTFTQGRTQENWTKPSVATLLSGIFPWQHTAVDGDSVVPASVELISETLQDRGFFTGCFIANGYVSDRFGFKQGWNTYRNYIREGRRTPAQYVAADVIEWLDRRPQDKPFLLYVHTIDPHVPYRPPEEFLSFYDDGAYRGPVDFSRDATLLENIKIGRIRLNDRDKERLAALYDGELSYHDVHFTAILEALERRGLADDTLVVLTSDHGEEFWDHGSVGHGHSVYEELLHVPLFVRRPGQRGAQRLDDNVGLVDVLPTIFASLGLEAPEELAGRSLLPLLTGQPVPERRFSVSGFMDRDRVVVAGRYKMIHRGLERFEVFDLASDPHETRDVSAEHPEVVYALRGMLGLRLAQTQAGHASRSERSSHAPHQAQTTTIDPQLEAQLRALGYVQ